MTEVTYTLPPQDPKNLTNDPRGEVALLNGIPPEALSSTGEDRGEGEIVRFNFPLCSGGCVYKRGIRPPGRWRTFKCTGYDPVIPTFVRGRNFKVEASMTTDGTSFPADAPCLDSPQQATFTLKD